MAILSRRPYFVNCTNYIIYIICSCRRLIVGVYPRARGHRTTRTRIIIYSHRPHRWLSSASQQVCAASLHSQATGAAILWSTVVVVRKNRRAYTMYIHIQEWTQPTHAYSAHRCLRSSKVLASIAPQRLPEIRTPPKALFLVVALCCLRVGQDINCPCL